MPNVYGYARKSPDGRRNPKRPLLSVDVQDARLRAAAAELYPEYPYIQTFVDDDTSARKISWKSRRGFNELLSAVHKGDIVLVVDLDRIERGGPLRTCAAMEAMHDRGAICISLNPSQRLGDDPFVAELMMAVWGLIARMQAEQTSQKTKETLAYMREKGYRTAPVPPLGYIHKRVEGETNRGHPQYMVVPDRKLCEVIVNRVWLARKQGVSSRKIARQLDREQIEPRPGRKWYRHDKGGDNRGRCYYVSRAMEAVNKAIAQGKTDYGGVPIPIPENGRRAATSYRADSA